MKVIIIGGTGFIGRKLTAELTERGDEVVCLTRNTDKARKILGEGVLAVHWEGERSRDWLIHAEDAGAVINLAGENIGSGRWTRKKRKRILESRLASGRAVVDAVKSTGLKSGKVIQASAVGYYGARGSEEIDETSPAGKGFLSDLVRVWEDSTKAVEDFGVKRVIIRSGLVFGRNGGVFPRLVRPFRFFLGGPLGSGRQWISWIHLDDEIRAILFLLDTTDSQGVYNLTSPGALSQRELARRMGKIMKRPAFFRVPAFLLRLLYGQMAQETLLSGQNVVPNRLVKSGFRFRFPNVETAVKDILEA